MNGSSSTIKIRCLLGEASVSPTMILLLDHLKAQMFCPVRLSMSRKLIIHQFFDPSCRQEIAA